MSALAEVPLVRYTLSPDGTRVRSAGWLSENGRPIAILAAVVIGVSLTVNRIGGLT